MITSVKNTTYNTIVCAGTFDFLHEGHKTFLRFAFAHGRHVIVGLTSDVYIQKFKPGNEVHTFAKRKEALEKFLQQEHVTHKVVITAIDTPFGFADEISDIDAIVVTEATEKGAKEINTAREKNGLPALTILICPLIKINSIALSSTAIRKGEMIDPSWETHILVLPEQLRETLKMPLGSLITNGLEKILTYDSKKIITVGDVTTQRLLEQGIHPKIAIVDFVIERKKTYASLHELGFTNKEKVMHLKNPSGQITPHIWHVLSEISKYDTSDEQYIITVDGEEDLLVLPLVFALPLGYHVLYGQPQKGLVDVEITIEKKKHVYDLLLQFQSKDY